MSALRTALRTGLTERYPLFPASILPGLRRRTHPWYLIRGELAKQVELDAWVRVLVQLRAQHALRLRRPGARDGQIKTERVALGAIERSRSMESYSLVSQNVVAGRDVLGDLHQPAVIVVGQFRGAPDVLGCVDQADLVDLEELELRLVDGGLHSLLACLRKEQKTIAR